jgi:hypothetical protein
MPIIVDADDVIIDPAFGRLMMNLLRAAGHIPVWIASILRQRSSSRRRQRR